MFRRPFHAFLAAAFAAMSLLGHGGLHLLPGGHDGHEHGHTAAQQADKAHSHAHHTHGHVCSHAHSHSPADQSQESPAAPFEHDHDNCVVCQWHAQGQLSTVDVPLPLSGTCCDAAAQPPAQVVTSFRLTSLLTRGPPQS